MRTISVSLPQYLVRAIEHSAAADDIAIDDWLQPSDSVSHEKHCEDGGEARTR